MTALRVGEALAGYRVLESVGAGGMGRVYRAVHPALQRIVALKVIRDEIAAEETFRERFRREARLSASIDHPCVVPVYDADEVDGVLFIAMRWVAGSDLRRLLAVEGPLGPERAVHLLGQIAAAAGAAHELGLVHRDIKPANVLLEGERAFLSDFGVARLLPEAEATTITGGFLGTIDYAAPELLDGEAGSTQSDIYALGCVLHEMLTGSVPYPVESLLAKVHAHARGKLTVPSTRRPDLPRGLDKVVRRCLAIDPAARFATTGELAASAERALRTPPTRRSASARRCRGARSSVLAGTSLLAGAAAAVAIAIPSLLSAGPAAPYDSGGRRLPEPASLEKCVNGLAGSPRMCLNPADGDGVVEIGDQGRPVGMSTMNVDVTGVALASALPVGSTGGEVIAPTGTHFVVVDLTVTNVTHVQHEFEPSEDIYGRLTMLLLFPAGGGALSDQGPRSADYSVQYEPAINALQRPLYQAELPPGQPIRGQLVFYYPNPELREAKVALLAVKELGEPFSAMRSEALIRLRL